MVSGVICANGQTSGKAEIVKFKFIEQYLSKNNADTLYVINFWATWCKPCVEELPAFEKLAEENHTKPIKVLLISLDYDTDSNKVNAFIVKKKIHSSVKILNEPNPNAYINKISDQWSGAIPATLIIGGKSKEKLFFEKSFNYQELQSIINPLIP